MTKEIRKFVKENFPELIGANHKELTEKAKESIAVYRKIVGTTSKKREHTIASSSYSDINGTTQYSVKLNVYDNYKNVAGNNIYVPPTIYIETEKFVAEGEVKDWVKVSGITRFNSVEEAIEAVISNEPIEEEPTIDKKVKKKRRLEDFFHSKFSFENEI